MRCPAVEAKLTEQREFVLWWDGQEKHPGNRGGAAIADRRRPTLKSLGVDKDSVHRWRGKLKAPEKYDITLAAAKERCRQVCEAEKGGAFESTYVT